ncbi:transcription repressor OFP8-like [Dioscorea cayenensis subsp. rotundata]|uniref:Transcription repressor n=1 Tax=Dioscorea cayennensis subsp. rotundata TaxID=55577 RepID=A0AB40CGD0_DIOCR|nr:transcription repressor OFP8-like [Dioscorea cayenensis subsp. rotundata]
MSSSKRNMTIRRQPIIVDLGCSCRRGKLSSIFFSPKKPKKHFNYFSSSSTTSNSTTSTTTSSSSFSYQHSPHKPNVTKSQKKGKITEESVAVEKDSSEPYLDFRESMVQMIVQNEIYGWDELRELLHRMLSLNSPQYHPLILRAFSDVCQAVFTPTSP